MNARAVLGNESGYVFCGEAAGSYCFVPEDCVLVDRNGDAIVAELCYVGSGWSTRNLRWSEALVPGSHLFPDSANLIRDLSSSDVQHFLQRIRAAGGLRAGLP